MKRLAHRLLVVCRVGVSLLVTIGVSRAVLAQVCAPCNAPCQTAAGSGWCMPLNPGSPNGPCVCRPEPPPTRTPQPTATPQCNTLPCGAPCRLNDISVNVSALCVPNPNAGAGSPPCVCRPQPPPTRTPQPTATPQCNNVPCGGNCQLNSDNGVSFRGVCVPNPNVTAANAPCVCQPPPTRTPQPTQTPQAACSGENANTCAEGACPPQDLCVENHDPNGPPCVCAPRCGRTGVCGGVCPTLPDGTQLYCHNSPISSFFLRDDCTCGPARCGDEPSCSERCDNGGTCTSVPGVGCQCILPDCGDAAAPACNASCPAGLTCTSINDPTTGAVGCHCAALDCAYNPFTGDCDGGFCGNGGQCTKVLGTNNDCQCMPPPTATPSGPQPCVQCNETCPDPSGPAGNTDFRCEVAAPGSSDTGCVCVPPLPSCPAACNLQPCISVPANIPGSCAPVAATTGTTCECEPNCNAIPGVSPNQCSAGFCPAGQICAPGPNGGCGCLPGTGQSPP